MTAKANKGGEQLANREVVMTRTFDAPREIVFKMWTDPNHMAQWWGPHGFTNPVCELDVRPGGAIRIDMRDSDGAVYPMTGTFREIVRPERLVFTAEALDQNGAAVLEVMNIVTFEEKNGKTTLTLQARVTKVAGEGISYLEGMEEGWTQSLERLASHLKSKNEPLVIERTFNAPAARVWRALTDKDEMKRWYFDLKEFKPEVGFEFQFTVEHEGFKYSHHCKIKEVIPGKKLVHSWRYEGYQGDSQVTFELFAEGNQTRLKLTHEGLESFPKIAAFSRTNFMEGWTQIIGSSLKEFVDQQTKLKRKENYDYENRRKHHLGNQASH
jgi:uncharacterized protein YndB with AHSA1/START domain